MNITELARMLKVNPNDLRDRLPELGFNIGYKAIKVDNTVAKKIIAVWPAFVRRKEREERERRAEVQRKKGEAGKDRPIVEVGAFISVRDLAAAAGLPVNRILAELIKNSIFSSMNEKIDFDTASIIGVDLGIEIRPAAAEVEAVFDNSSRVKDVLAAEAICSLRPPVIVVMGHVDHGKTKLLDAIRHTNIMGGEAGGITQHIGAYQVERRDRKLTFIDTPGHEAFTAMRNRGAKVADIAVLVVAADDGVMPQTVEAYRIIQAAGIPFVVAINKIDKEDADIQKVKQELANKLNILSEDWGGQAICVPVSARDNKNIDELLDTLILVADMEVDNLQANAEGKTLGTIIESNMDKSEGAVATLLVQNGTLGIGDELMCNGVDYGKARNLKNYLGKAVLKAGPSTPVKIIGFKHQPVVGDIIEVGHGIKVKMTKASKVGMETPTAAIPVEKNEDGDDVVEEKIVLMLKGDTLGSVEAIENSLNKIDTQGVKVKIIAKSLGNISGGDISRAQAGSAKLLGFNVKISPQAAESARNGEVVVKTYKIIYELINDIKAEIQELVKPEIVRVDTGRIKVLAIFRTDKKSQILGGKVLSGEVKPGYLTELERDNEIIDNGKIVTLKTGKEDVDMVEAGNECGFGYETRTPVVVGDLLNIYREDKIYKKIK